MIKILIADDDVLLLEVVSRYCSALGFNVISTVTSGKDAIQKSIELNPELILMDINMDYQSDGIDACSKIKMDNPKIKVVFISGYKEEIYKDQLSGIDYDGYRVKPVSMDILQKTITSVSG